ncbi:hypothetical protein L484_004633 [Morus notabilis]|uniref:Uncharacterized protein n=1 Tax=Morus notabilis TaxID=981085 RepID=W9QMS2_9ROSA|nr:hypothetical protein L484_004633 [Morus notabilis]
MVLNVQNNPERRTFKHGDNGSKQFRNPTKTHNPRSRKFAKNLEKTTQSSAKNVKNKLSSPYPPKPDHFRAKAILNQY